MRYIGDIKGQVNSCLGNHDIILCKEILSKIANNLKRKIRPTFAKKHYFFKKPLVLYTVCTYNISMAYEWDPNKAIANIEKHGIDFADAVTVFDDGHAITIDDPDYDEQRFVTIAMDAFGQILVVVYTWRGNIIRLISARKATKRERKQYEE